MKQCSSATRAWERPPSSRASCTTRSRRTTRSVPARRRHGGAATTNQDRLGVQLTGPDPFSRTHTPTHHRRQSGSTSCPRPCTWRIARCGCSSGTPRGKSKSSPAYVCIWFLDTHQGPASHGGPDSSDFPSNPTHPPNPRRGDRRFRSLIPSYIRDSSVAVVVYDITSACSGQCPWGRRNLIEDRTPPNQQTNNLVTPDPTRQTAPPSSTRPSGSRMSGTNGATT